jgi:hypothetical protein
LTFCFFFVAATIALAWMKVGKVAAIMDLLDPMTHLMKVLKPVFQGGKWLVKAGTMWTTELLYSGGKLTLVVLDATGQAASRLFTLPFRIDGALYSLLVPVDIPGAVVRFVEVIKDGSGQLLRDAQGRMVARLEVNGQQVIGVVEEAASVVARLRARLVSSGWQAADIDLFLADFANNAEALAKFDNGGLDFDVWKKFASLTGDTKAWVRKSVALQERIKANRFTDADVDRLKNYYSTFQKPSAMKDALPPFDFVTPEGITVHFDEFASPRFEPFVPQMQGVGKVSYNPDRIGAVNLPAGNSPTLRGNGDILDANRWIKQNYPNKVRDELPDGTKIPAGRIQILDGNGNWIECTWHHHDDGRNLIPVPSTIHTRSTGASHTGGNSLINNGLKDFFDALQF